MAEPPNRQPQIIDAHRNLADGPKAEPKRICVIGAGPSGLAALKVIKDTPQYKNGIWTAVAFEARENVGGVWLPAPPLTENPPLTPVYDSLTTNLPHPIMAYSSFPFPPSTPVFPHASIVKKYLMSYAEHFGLMPHIRLNTKVESVERKSGKWEVNVSTGESFLFDLVMVCNGHYGVPRYPDTPGIEDWLKEGRASHSAWYRHPYAGDFGNTVLVVGAGASGSDIAAELQSVALRTVIHSTTGTTSVDIGNLKKRGRVSKFEGEGRVVFDDGTVESSIDHCICATGYQVSLPFLSEPVIRDGIPPPAPPLPSEVYNTTYSVFPLAKHIFPVQEPSLAFIGLQVRVIPFPLVEAQARATLHVFAHPESFDPAQEAQDILTRYEFLRTRVGTDDPHRIAKAWALFNWKEGEQFDYRDRLCEFAAGSFSDVIKVEGWERVMNKNKYELRRVWKELERRGEAEEWVKGVGEEGEEEWVVLLERMLDRAKEMGLPVQLDDGYEN